MALRWPTSFLPKILEDLEQLLRRADRMGTTTMQMEMDFPSEKLNVAVTVATLQHQGQQLGYVLVFEDLSDLLKAQKQAAWREVARRVAHEIKNPLTPIALSAERMRRHLARDGSPMKLPWKFSARAQKPSPAPWRPFALWWMSSPPWPASPRRSRNPPTSMPSCRTLWPCSTGVWTESDVHTELASDLPAVMGDPEALKRALANLVDNAAEAMQIPCCAKFEISTALVASRDAVEISVADTGHGVTRS